MIHHYIIKPVAEMRAEPSSSSEVVSQALFSENVKVLERSGSWTLISTPLDHYSGWVTHDTLFERASPQDHLPYVTIKRLAAHVYRVEDTIYGPILTLPFESRLLMTKEPESPNSRWIEIITPNGESGFVQRGDVSFSLPKLTLDAICEFSHHFLGLPYTWGGRSSFGYDCSGFVQMLYRQMDVHLPRDSQDQCNWKDLREVSLEDLHPGDLLFWGLGPDKIRHVALHLENGKFIHTSAVTENSPYLRLSSLKDQAWNGSGHYPYLCARRLAG